MEGKVQSVEELLGGTSKQLIVPIYQRHYSWEKEQCKQLWEDIIRLHGMPNGKHYLGTTLRSTTSESGENASYIIDGQQRITSIFLLLKALVDIAEQEAQLERPRRVEEEAERNVQRFLDLAEKPLSEEREAKLRQMEREKAEKMVEAHIECPIDPTRFRNTIRNDLLELPSQGKESFHIRLNECDNNDLQAIFYKPDRLDEINHNIVVMYQFFLSMLKKEIGNKDRWPNGFTVEDFYKLVKRLYVFDICLGNDDNAQAIFESINATGLALADCDKIRNLVLLNVSREKQKHLFTKYWNPTETVFAEKGDMDTFCRYYLMLKLGREVKETQVYASFKDYWNRSVGVEKADQILDDIKHFAEVYSSLLWPRREEHSQLWQILFRMHVPEYMGIPSLFLMSARDYCQKLYADSAEFEVEFVRVLRMVESFLFRRFICECPSNTHTGIFLGLHREVGRLLQEHGGQRGYADCVAEALEGLTGAHRFPRDTEFRNALRTRRIYSLRSPVRNYLFARLNEGVGVEGESFANVYERLRLPQNAEGRYTVEHVMPQTLTEEWRRMLGREAESVHADYLHLLGNLTLTSYNSSYANRPFAEKLHIHKQKVLGLAESPIKLNIHFRNTTKWGKEEIIRRGEYLADLAVELWPWFGQAEIPASFAEEEVKYSLGVQKSLAGYEILAFRFKGRQEAVNVWNAMYQSVYKQLYAELGDDLKLARASISWISTEKPEGDGYLRLSDTLYVARVRTISVEEMLRRLRRLFNFLEISLDDLEFTVKRTSLDNDAEDEEGEPLESDGEEAADNGELF